MSGIEINKVVIHELVKEQHQPMKKPNLRDKVLDTESEPVQKLVAGVVGLYGQRNNSAQYGIFRKDMESNAFPEAFGKYVKLMTPGDTAFMDLTLLAMEALRKRAELIQSASGGYMLYADYVNARKRYFLVAMIKQKDGITLSEHLEPEELTQLDLNRLHQAAKINFDKFTEYYGANEKDRQELNYLSFVSPSSSKGAAEYFIAALGCTRGTASAAATRNVIQESSKFFLGDETLKKHHLDFKNDLMEYLAKKGEQKEPARLSEIEKIARQYFPAEKLGQADEMAERYISRLNSDECGVPVEFSINKTVLVKHRQIRYKADDWELNFERSALGDTDNAGVHYDRDLNRLIFNNLPDPLVRLIKEALEEQNTG